MVEKICGVYQIFNIANGKMYIGSSINIIGRWRDHKKKLKKNNHENSYLQNAYNKYGESKFIYSILTKFLIEQPQKILIECEEYWIQYYETKNREGKGYNAREVAESVAGMKWSDNQKEKQSKSKKGKYCGEKHPQAKYSEVDVAKMRFYFENNILTREELRKIYNIISSNLNNILSYRIWKVENNDEKQIEHKKNIKYHSAKVNYEIAEQMRNEYYENNVNIQELSKKYKINVTNVRKVINNLSWINKERKTVNIKTYKESFLQPFVSQIYFEYENKILTKKQITIKYKIGYRKLNDILNNKQKIQNISIDIKKDIS